MKNLFTLRWMNAWAFILIFVFTAMETYSQVKMGYQTPPQEMVELVDAPGTPGSYLSPDSKWFLLAERQNMPTIATLSQPELRIAGLRINPRTNGPSRTSYSTSLKLKSLEDGKEYPIKNLPEKALLGNISWSNDGNFIAFTHTTETSIELWVADAQSMSARRVGDDEINAALRGRPYTWMSDNQTIVYKSILSDRGDIPEKPSVPKGPVISENSGRAAAVRTYQDLLKNPYDESLFEYFVQAQLNAANVATNTISKVGNSGLISSFSVSPDANYFMVEVMAKPFSYLVPYYRFAHSIEIWNKGGEMVKKLADIPLGENIPKGFMAVRTGPRSHTWRADAPASVYWVEAQDEGNPRNKVKYRDKLYHLDAPFNGDVQEDIAFELRYRGITWGDDDMAIASEYWRSTRRMVSSMFSPSSPSDGKTTVFDRSMEDRYNNPGSFRTARNEFGRRVLLTDKKGKYLYLTGAGASPEGDKPFIDQYNLKTKETSRLWQSEAPYYESVSTILDLKKNLVITTRESKEMPPNYFIRNLKTDELTQITQFNDPYPGMKGVKKELLKYDREDGVQLTGTLYTPSGYDPEKDGPIPVLMWAYPREFKSAAAASQVRSSPYRFTRLRSTSPLLWLTQGYAVMSDPAMPIIGEDDQEPNDTYVKQLVSSAKAAIDKLVEMGVADREKVAIGGHSYGAFMTANLLAHSDLFACGIARSGAYNRTLTPFGFQAEERTFWEAPDIYFKMSPFMHADKVNEPILMIHGMADNNSGTFPIQSERFYHALKGHGANVRLVMLPHESHGYRARESVMHTLWETDTFMKKHMGESSFKQSR